MRTLFIALLIALPAIIFAQPNFHEGYVIKNNGDTLKGFINYREWVYSPTEIEFKPGNGADVAKFGPGAIKSFQIKGLENYFSYSGRVSTNENIFPALPYRLDTATQQKAVFLKRLVAGNNVTLYYNNEQNKKRFFIAETNQPPVELKYYEYYVAIGGNEIFDNVFRGQLILLNNKFKNGSQKLLNAIAEARYVQSDLEQITTRLNDENISSPAASENTNSHPKSARFFAGLGANDITTTYKYIQSVNSVSNSSGTTTSYDYASYHSNTIAPKINLGLDIFINPNVQQFIFRSELSFSYSNGLFDRTVEAVDGDFLTYNYQFTQYTTSLTPQLLFNVYNTDKLKFYIDGGVTLNLSSYTYNNAAEVAQNSLQLNSFWAYFPFQAGVVFNKKAEVYFTYSTGASFSNYTDFSVSNQYMSLGFKYLF
jgi:hypothetical protein